jgi:lysosomal Pro-X carboxypeptidase
VGVLTEAQVLEDFTALATHLRANLSAWDSPLIALGGSLAGEMATWWRVRYPFMVDMALAASAPILGFPGLTDQYGWYRTATDAFRAVGGDACVDAIRAGYWQTAALSPAAASAAFATCTPASLPCHARQLADLVMDWAATAAELGSYPASDPARSLTVWACGRARGAASGLAAYQRLLAPQAPGQCLNISWAAQCDAAAPAAAAAADGGWCATHYNDTTSGCQDGWGIESCTTEIHPITANNVTDFFPPDARPFNQTDRLLGCRQNYGSNLRVDGDAMPRAFGQFDLARMAASASRIIFSSGSFDPWSAQSINRSLSATLPFILIEGGAHHSDIGNNYNRACAAGARRRRRAAAPPSPRAPFPSLSQPCRPAATRPRWSRRASRRLRF